MDPSRIALFDLADRRLAWVGRRQEVLAQNIANADTPGWRSRDLKPFAEALSRAGVAPVRTHAQHLSPHRSNTMQDRIQQGERAPDGNAVALDVELAKVADSESTHSLVTGLYTKYLALFRAAAGR